MVTLDQAPGLEVTVNVDGVPLREYEDPSDDGGRNKALRYVEAQPGKEFSIVIQLAPRFKHMQRHSVTSDVKVDGKVIVRPLFNREHVYDGGVTRTVNGVERMVKNNWEKRHLTFSNLDIDNTSARPSGPEDKKFKELGEISVTFYLGTVAGRSETQDTGYKFDSTDAVHEKALKGRAVSYNTSLGRTVSARQPSIFSFNKLDDDPFVTVTFRYRSLADLKSEMVIPRSPSPGPLEHRPIEQLTPEQMRELLRRQRANVGPSKWEVKRERRDVDDDEEDESDGLEVVHPPPKRQRVIETVDLTSD